MSLVYKEKKTMLPVEGDSNEEVCNCSCHTRDLVHCLPCCEQCKKCRKNIVHSYIQSHEKFCKGIGELPPPAVEDDFR